jgi:hypothetical protein
MAMPAGTWDEGEFGAFPAFLSRPKVEAPANDDIADNHAPRSFSGWLRGLWAGSLVARITRETTMRNGRDSMQEAQTGRGAARVQQSIADQYQSNAAEPGPQASESVLLAQVTTAIEAFRKIEGERMLAQMLESLLGRSRQVLTSHGIAAPSQESATVAAMRKQIAALEDRCHRGDEAYAKLQADLDEARSAYQDLSRQHNG